jgi:hypothetical protein
MPKEILISDIVDLTGTEQDINTLIANINKVDKAIQQINKNPINVGQVGGLRELKQATDELIKATGQLSAAINETTKARTNSNKDALTAARIATEEAKQTDLLARAKKEEAKASLESTRAKELENKEREKASKVSASEEKAIRDISNDYLQLSKSFTDAALKAKNYYLTLGANHPVTIQAVKDANDINNILKKVDESVGQYGRNVGNYKSGFNGLGNSVSQIARELPSLTISAQQFFLAISNNLPILQDEISKAKREIAELKAAGEAAPSLGAKLRDAIFSPQVAFAVGIALLTAFSGKIVEFFKNVFIGRTELEKMKETVEKLTIAFAQLNRETQYNIEGVKQNIAAQIELAKKRGATEKEVSGIVQQGYTDEYKVFEQSSKKKADAIHKLIPEYYLQLNSVQDVQTLLADLENTIANPKFSKEKEINQERMKGAKQLTTELLADLQSRNQSGFNSYQEYLKFEADYAKKVRDTLRDLSEEEVKNTIEALEKQRTARFELSKLVIQDEIDKQKAIADAGVTYFSADARKKQADAEIELIKKTTQEELHAYDLKIEGIKRIRDIKLSNPELSPIEIQAIKTRADLEIKAAILTSEQIKLIKEKESRSIIAIEVAMVSEILQIRHKIQQEANDEARRDAQFLLDDEQRKLQARLSALQRGAEGEQRGIQKLADERLAIVNREYAQGKIDKQKFEDEKRKIENEALAKSLNSQIAYYKALAILYELDSTEREKLLAKIAELEKKLAELGAKVTSEHAKVINEHVQAYLRLGDELNKLVFSVFAAASERRINQLNAEKDALEERYQKETDFINQTYTNQAQRQQKQAELDARYHAQKKQLEDQEKKEKTKQAIAQKASTIFSIILDTAKAIANDLDTPWKIPIDAAIGAAELAIAIATPIPRYFKGKNADDNYQGYAWVDDGGRPEAIIRQDGSVEVGSNKPRVTYLNSKDIVLPDARMLAWNATASITNKAFTTTESEFNRNDYMAGVKRIEKALKNQPAPKVIMPDPLDLWMNSNKSWDSFRG